MDGEETKNRELYFEIIFEISGIQCTDMRYPRCSSYNIQILLDPFLFVSKKMQYFEILILQVTIKLVTTIHLSSYISSFERHGHLYHTVKCLFFCGNCAIKQLYLRDAYQRTPISANIQYKNQKYHKNKSNIPLNHDSSLTRGEPRC